MQIVLATHNRGKMEEMVQILDHLSVELLTLDAFPIIGDIPETGSTLKENAFIKAETVHKITGLPALADDTGLEVDALNGAPGVYSARYAGENATFEDNCNKMLSELDGLPMAHSKRPSHLLKKKKRIVFHIVGKLYVISQSSSKNG